MYDKELVCAILKQIADAIHKIERRFETISEPENFTNTPEGMDKLDAICMMLIAIGESVKNIDKITSKTLLLQYPDMDWKGVMGLRDIISHHYFDIDAEEIFWICRHQMKPLSQMIEKMIEEMKR